MPVGVVDDSTDFIVANHVLEHCENPLGTLENWVDKLSPGGILFITVPDMEKTFDRDRAVTAVEHLLANYRKGPSYSREDHVRELLGPAP